VLAATLVGMAVAVCEATVEVPPEACAPMANWEDEAAEKADEAEAVVSEDKVSIVLAATLVGIADGRSALVAVEDEAADCPVP